MTLKKPTSSSEQKLDRMWNIPLSIYANENELLQALYQQEEPACTCLFKRFARQLYALALRMVKSPEEAEEIIQEGFLQACSHVRDFEQRSSLQTWLYRIVSNTALMHLRRKHLDTLSLEEAQDRWKNAASEELSPDAQVVDQELRAAVRLAVEQLPETLRAPFLLRSIEGQSTKEAARNLGISEGTLKVRLHRARGELRHYLQSFLYEEGSGSSQQ